MAAYVACVVLVLSVASGLNAGAPSTFRDAPEQVICQEVFDPETGAILKRCGKVANQFPGRYSSRGEVMPVMNERMMAEQPRKFISPEQSVKPAPPRYLLNSLSPHLTRVAAKQFDQTPKERIEPYPRYPTRAELPDANQPRVAGKGYDVGGFHHGYGHHGGYHGGFYDQYHGGYGGYHNGYHGGHGNFGHHGSFYHHGFRNAETEQRPEVRTVVPYSGGQPVGVSPYQRRPLPSNDGYRPAGYPQYPRYPLDNQNARIMFFPQKLDRPLDRGLDKLTYIKASDLVAGPLVVPDAGKILPPSYGYPAVPQHQGVMHVPQVQETVEERSRTSDRPEEVASSKASGLEPETVAEEKKGLSKNAHVPEDQPLSAQHSKASGMDEEHPDGLTAGSPRIPQDSLSAQKSAESEDGDLSQQRMPETPKDMHVSGSRQPLEDSDSAQRTAEDRAFPGQHTPEYLHEKLGFPQPTQDSLNLQNIPEEKVFSGQRTPDYLDEKLTPVFPHLPQDSLNVQRIPDERVFPGQRMPEYLDEKMAAGFPQLPQDSLNTQRIPEDRVFPGQRMPVYPNEKLPAGFPQLPMNSLAVQRIPAFDGRFPQQQRFLDDNSLSDGRGDKVVYNVKLPVEDDVLDPQLRLFPVYNIRCRLEPAKPSPEDIPSDSALVGDIRSAAIPQEHSFYKRDSEGKRKVTSTEFLERLSAINAKLKQIKD